jgi:hypothetical protein
MGSSGDGHLFYAKTLLGSKPFYQKRPKYSAGQKKRIGKALLTKTP